MVNISIPPKLRRWLERRVSDGGFATTSEYVQHLLRLAQVADSVDEMDARLIESEKSGSGRTLSKRGWDALRRRGDRRVARVAVASGARPTI